MLVGLLDDLDTDSSPRRRDVFVRGGQVELTLVSSESFLGRLASQHQMELQLPQPRLVNLRGRSQVRVNKKLLIILLTLMVMVYHLRYG